MPVDYFDWFFTLVAAGLGLLLVGGLNVVFGRKGDRVWLRSLAMLALCAAVVAGAAAFARLGLALRAGGVVAAVVLVTMLIGSDWLARQLASVVAFVRKPSVRWGLVAVAGLASIVGSGLAFDLIDEVAIDQTMKDLEMTVGRPPSRPVEGSQVTTDRGTLVVVKEPIEPRDPVALREPEEKVLQSNKVSDHVIRHGGASDVTNCHGWVFTGGKFLLSPDDVELILKENGYEEIAKPRPGDLVVYRQNGVISHTAIVEYVTPGKPVIVEGKWGTMGVFSHAVDKSCYGTDYKFYRSARQGHILAGLSGTGPAQPELPSE